MTGATFLLTVNFSIGVAFAIAFLSMSGLRAAVRKPTTVAAG